MAQAGEAGDAAPARGRGGWKRRYSGGASSPWRSRARCRPGPSRSRTSSCATRSIRPGRAPAAWAWAAPSSRWRTTGRPPPSTRPASPSCVVREIAVVGFHDRLTSRVDVPGIEGASGFTDEAHARGARFRRRGRAVRGGRTQLHPAALLPALGRSLRPRPRDGGRHRRPLGHRPGPQGNGRGDRGGLPPSKREPSTPRASPAPGSSRRGCRSALASTTGSPTGRRRARARSGSAPALPCSAQARRGAAPRHATSSRHQSMRGFNANLGVLVRYPWLSLGASRPHALRRLVRPRRERRRERYYDPQTGSRAARAP